jgi:mono/diheme cytochrome c family protein
VWLLVLVAAVCTRAADGAAVYESNCAPCHGLDGKARTPAGKKLGAHDLSESKFDDATLTRQIRDGVKSPQGAERMPAFKERLKPDEISAVVEFVKTFRKK